MGLGYTIVEAVTVSLTETQSGTGNWTGWRPSAEFSVRLEGAVSHPPVVVSWTDETLSEDQAETVTLAARWHLARKLWRALDEEPRDIKAKKGADGWETKVNWKLTNGPDVTVTVASFNSLDDAKREARKLLRDVATELAPKGDDPLRANPSSLSMSLNRPGWFKELFTPGGI